MSDYRVLRPLATDPESRQAARVAALEDRLYQLKSQVGRVISIQTINGTSGAYSPSYTTDIPVLTSVGGPPLALTYTPPVDVWWEAALTVGLLEKEDTAYGYSYGYLQLSVPDVDGIQYGFVIGTQNINVTRYNNRHPKRIFKLAAGTTYTVSARLNTPSTGSFRYYHGSGYLWLSAKAYIR